MSTPSREDATSILECFLFEEIDNNRIPHEDTWAIAWEGDDFVLLHEPTEELFHFRVTIEPHEWDSTQVRKEQEWEV